MPFAIEEILALSPSSSIPALGTGMEVGTKVIVSQFCSSHILGKESTYSVPGVSESSLRPDLAKARPTLQGRNVIPLLV